MKSVAPVEKWCLAFAGLIWAVVIEYDMIRLISHWRLFKTWDILYSIYNQGKDIYCPLACSLSKPPRASSFLRPKHASHADASHESIPPTPTAARFCGSNGGNSAREMGWLPGSGEQCNCFFSLAEMTDFVCFSNFGWTSAQQIRSFWESCCMFVCCPLNSSLIRFHPCTQNQSDT